MADPARAAMLGAMLGGSALAAGGAQPAGGDQPGHGQRPPRPPARRRLIRAGILTGGGTGQAAAYEVTADGAGTLAEFGVDVAEVRRSRRRFAGACLDWTQRRPHLNGALGAAVTGRLLELGWIERGPSRRAVRVTEPGRAGLAATFGWSLPG